MENTLYGIAAANVGDSRYSEPIYDLASARLVSKEHLPSGRIKLRLRLNAHNGVDMIRLAKIGENSLDKDPNYSWLGWDGDPLGTLVVKNDAPFVSFKIPVAKLEGASGLVAVVLDSRGVASWNVFPMEQTMLAPPSVQVRNEATSWGIIKIK